jgi:hypothetical protein
MEEMKVSEDIPEQEFKLPSFQFNTIEIKHDEWIPK